MQEDVETRLAQQATDASNTGKKIEVDEDRVPQSKHLPLSLRQYVLDNTKDCRSACKGFPSGDDEFAWVAPYFNEPTTDLETSQVTVAKGLLALERCAQNEIPLTTKEDCAVSALKSCVSVCDADTSEEHSEGECASACLQIHNETLTAPDWGAKYYAQTVNDEYTQCVDKASSPFLKAENCLNQQVSACVSDCQASGEEELSSASALLINSFPKSKLSLGLDLQGGIDMDLEVEIGEAVLSKVQREVASVRESLETSGLEIIQVRREVGLPVLMIQLDEGTTLTELQGVFSNRFTNYEFQNEVMDGDVTEYAFALKSEAIDDIGEKSIQQALETLRNRIDETGVKEPSIVVKGGAKINVQLPGVKDVQQAMSVIGTAAVLEFMLVDEEAMANPRDLERALLDAEKILDTDIYTNDNLLTNHLLKQKALLPNTRLMWEYRTVDEGEKERGRYFVVKDNVILTGDDINDAQVAIDQYNQPYTSMEFKPVGANIFAQVTEENKGKRFAIVLDKDVKSAPYIREKISGGRASIDMGSNDYQQALQEASTLSLVLRTGALPAPVTIGKVRMVGASLGKDAVEAGRLATMVGFSLVLLFMLVYYGKAGIVSVIALLANVVLVFAFLCTAGATLTLPGITGIALTIGMAVDCNIIIYERIREELRLGKNARAAVKTGFDKALLAVLDANITTFIAGIVLYTYGTGPIKGFAVTLMIGIISTLFTGVFVSRTLMDFITRRANATINF
jgi:preprotein translocase subunit SecD